MRFTPSLTELAAGVDTISAQVTFTPSFTEVYQPASGTDSFTIPLKLTPRLAYEEQFFFDTLITTEMRRHFESGDFDSHMSSEAQTRRFGSETGTRIYGSVLTGTHYDSGLSRTKSSSMKRG